MFLWPLISGLLFARAQYSSPLISSPVLSVCDTSRLTRCQQDVWRDIQLVGLNAASAQFSISSGPPYSPTGAAVKQRDSQYATADACRQVRANLDCLLATTPACYEAGLQQALNSDPILRAKRFLEQYNCNEPDSTWQSTFCYRSNEVRSCEERYGFTKLVLPSIAQELRHCWRHQGFKQCVDLYLRSTCRVNENDMINEYIIDRTGDLAWRCPANRTSTSDALLNSPPTINNPYAINNSPGSLLSPSSSSYYDSQRQIPAYGGSVGGHLVREHGNAWERFRSPVDDARLGISRFPQSTSGEIFDRLVVDPESSDCTVKAAPYARECEDEWIERRQRALDSRDAVLLQRRMCCSLISLHNCVSRAVLDRCADSSVTAVDILMGQRRRELSIGCRNFDRELCSGAISSKLMNPLVLLVAVTLASLVSINTQHYRHS